MTEVPPFHAFIHPLMLVLYERGAPMQAREVYEVVANRVGLTEKQRAVMLPSNTQRTYHNRIGWANDYLKRAGLTRSPARGYWEITASGRDWIESFRDGAPESEIARIRKVSPSHRRRENLSVPEVEEPAVADLSPEERIDEATRELRESTKFELLERIGQCSPEFFERLVLDLLLAMGYGLNHTSLRQTGGAGDGGIDGVISLDRLGLEKVYVQAKRWKGNVGRPEVQAFFGALAGHRARKGVFITTSDYTREARDFAASVSDSLVLVNGDDLAGLMIDHGVGVSHRTLKLAKLDSDYFEDV